MKNNYIYIILKLGDFHLTLKWCFYMKEIKRDRFLKKLINKKENGLIKVITGIRRSGKSYLLFNLFKDFLLNNGISSKQIISISLDDDTKLEYRNTQKLSKYIRSKIKDKNKPYYILIDEVQYAITKIEMKSFSNIDLYTVLNGLMHLNNVDIYVTGSNSKMLSKDILTEFRGRSDSIEVFPLTFKEYYDFFGNDKSESLADYSLFGGMPYSLSIDNEDEKINYLRSLFTEVYFKDISERYDIAYPNILDELTNDLCSSIGSLTNSTKTTNRIETFISHKRLLQKIYYHQNIYETLARSTRDNSYRYLRFSFKRKYLRIFLKLSENHLTLKLKR